MGQLKKDIDELKTKVDKAIDALSIVKKQQELKNLEEQMSQTDFWSDQAAAKSISLKHANLKGQIDPWLKLSQELEELKQLDDLADGDGMQDELAKSLSELSETYKQLEMDLKFSGKYDSLDAIVTIQAGAGGTDAQDWVQMLQRMYIKWAENQPGTKAELIDETSGEEAGLKNTSLLISGPNAYGKLKGEHGVHRLVRLSPFNTGNTRETSFAMVEVVPKIEESADVEIDEKDLKIDVFRAGGHGGQSVNTTDSAVRITHLPTNITVAIQNERSQLQNKETAMAILRSKLAKLKEEQRAEKISDLKGPNIEAAWGNQIRNYVLHPYQLVKDTRTGQQTSDVQAVLAGEIGEFIESYLVADI